LASLATFFAQCVSPIGTPPQKKNKLKTKTKTKTKTELKLNQHWGGAAKVASALRLRFELLHFVADLQHLIFDCNSTRVLSCYITLISAGFAQQLRLDAWFRRCAYIQSSI
jgi:hypothetical protein